MLEAKPGPVTPPFAAGQAAAVAAPPSGTSGFGALVARFQPRMWLFLWAHCLTGFIVFNGRAGYALGGDIWMGAVIAGGIWAVMMGGSAAALYQAFFTWDRRDPELAPGRLEARERLGWVALGVLLAGLGLSMAVSWDYWDAYRGGMLLVAVYAAPPVRLGRWKAPALVLEALGLGALSFYAGMAALEGLRLVNPSIPLYLAGFGCLYLSLRMCAQERGRFSAWLYWPALAAAFACLAVAGVKGGNRWSAVLLVAPLGAWVVTGLARFDARSPALPRGAGGALAAWLVTDAAVALSALVR